MPAGLEELEGVPWGHTRPLLFKRVTTQGHGSASDEKERICHFSDTKRPLLNCRGREGGREGGRAGWRKGG
jgi:hypothetical protein